MSCVVRCKRQNLSGLRVRRISSDFKNEATRSIANAPA